MSDYLRPVDLPHRKRFVGNVNEDLQTIARILRAARKQLSLSQTDVAHKLGLQQAAWSRIESGDQFLTAQQWLEFCKITGISLESLRLGYIEPKTNIGIDSSSKVGSFRLPKRYASNRATKVRFLLPFFKYFEEQLGEKALDAFLKNTEIDLDYFVSLENQVNLDFVLDLCQEVRTAGKLDESAYMSLMLDFKRPESHGHLHYDLDAQGTQIQVVGSALRQFSHYDDNQEIKATSGSIIRVLAKPRKYAIEVLEKREKFLQRHLCHSTRAFSTALSAYESKSAGKIKVQEHQCFWKGAAHCEHEVWVA